MAYSMKGCSYNDGKGGKVKRKQKPKQRRATTELLIIQEDLRIHL